MTESNHLSGPRSILILNRPHVVTENNFYVDIFRIPEVLNRLRQYREILNANDINVPIWVYCLTQDLKSLSGSPQPFILNFLINLGLFDRWIAKNGWPQYIVGSDPLMSLIAGEVSFEEQILLLTQGYCQESQKLQLYKANSYYSTQTGSFCLTSLKRMNIHGSLKDIVSYLQKKMIKVRGEGFFQLLSPHEEILMDTLKSYNVYPKEFLEKDRGLKWLWPIWKRTQMQAAQRRDRQIC